MLMADHETNQSRGVMKQRSVTFSITVFETVESGEDTMDLGDGEIEVVFTGKILPGMCIAEMAAALRRVILLLVS